MRGTARRRTQDGTTQESKQAGPQSRTNEVEVTLSAADADVFYESQEKVEALQNQIKELRSMGLLAAAQAVHLEFVKERRRRRALCRESPDVALAIADRVDREEVRSCEQRRRAQAEHNDAVSAKRLKAEVNASSTELRRKKNEIKDLENVLEASHAMKTFTPEQLGKGAKGKKDLAKGQKARFDVLERLAHLGVGLSPEQRNDFAWFKSAWDTQLLEEHGAAWPETFAGWAQQVLDELAQEGGSNAFSVFVHNETLRCLCRGAALRLPGGSAVADKGKHPT